MVYVFIHLFINFIKLKKIKLSQEGGQFSRFNIFISVWSLFLISSYAIIFTTSFALKVTSYFVTDLYTKLRAFRYAVMIDLYSAIQYLSAVTILYFFYYQAHQSFEIKEGHKYLREQARKNIINTTNLQELIQNAKEHKPVYKKNDTLQKQSIAEYSDIEDPSLG